MSVIAQRVPLGPQWQTVDPFLFCANHDDRYPAGTPDLGPDPSLLAGRDIGQDFSGRDGWSMYHGSGVPGFPQHPHRGFETITYVRRGLIDHADSLGAAARFGQGDVQWITAGAGLVHSEMFPLLDADGPNHTQLFQIWLNLPAADKMVEPHFSMLWSNDIPTVTVDGDGAPVEITVIAGALDGVEPPAPPPHSWASRPEADVAVWHVTMAPGARWTLPPARTDEAVRTIYAFDGGPVTIGGEELAAANGGMLSPAGEPLTIEAGPEGAGWMLLQGRPIGEPVARYGPFVMNDRAGIEQAFADYQRTGFGGWPWPSDDPDHGPSRGRFARHADGRVEEAV
ncbi:MAG: pirin family protein [Actinomycetota bacterium]